MPPTNKALRRSSVESRASNDAWMDPTSIIETETIGARSRFGAYTHVRKEVTIGEDCIIGDLCAIDSGVVMGNEVTIESGTMICAGTVLEDGVFVGSGVIIAGDPDPRLMRLCSSRRRFAGRWLPTTTVKRGASLEAGVVLLAGVTVGEYAIVEAGTVVSRNVDSHSMVVGNPAEVRGWACRCGRQLTFEVSTAVCDRCDLVFVRQGDSVRVME